MGLVVFKRLILRSAERSMRQTVSFVISESKSSEAFVISQWQRVRAAAMDSSFVLQLYMLTHSLK